MRWAKAEKRGVILPGDDGSIFPIQPHARDPQPRLSEIDSVGNIRSSSGKIELQISRSSRSKEMRPKHFEANFRLPQGAAKGLSGHIRNLWNRPGGNVLRIQVSAIAEQIEQHNTRQPDTIL